jgi:hypothetical protein
MGTPDAQWILEIGVMFCSIRDSWAQTGPFQWVMLGIDVIAGVVKGRRGCDVSDVVGPDLRPAKLELRIA